MIVVIQCAARKHDDAGFLRTGDGRPVLFVAQPGEAPPDGDFIYARPDDLVDSVSSWRDVLLEYNRRGGNPLKLRPAFELYMNDSYRRLAERFGLENTFILSAGWGLINAAFLTPYYDITFSAAADSFKRRRKTEPYRDFCMLPDDSGGPVVFFGGKDYLPLFCELTRSVGLKRLVFYNSSQPPQAPGCSVVRFPTTTRTNWHYECVDAFLKGEAGREIGELLHP
ncbi:hypothetical protein HNQ36_002664 [Afipia massiliensis]|uniref:Uncharacterized protein n=1 Tax=Afipia massiliensis TaxID=211460 RepID=A0A840N0W6_9BRAD|nr:hypothetical protein [Afipia massiliensis]MBB5052690.1 hypothetical protein [Afipia massiliensis]